VNRVTVHDLIDLVASGISDPEARLEKVFECAHARNLELVKWLLALGAALVAGIVVAVVKADPTAKISIRVVELTLFGAGVTAAAGIFLLMRGYRIYRTYLAAQTLLGEIVKIRPFVELYREQS
jgi:hypothetical protein